jgi:hypothetical protein
MAPNPLAHPKLLPRQCHDGEDTLCEPYDYALYGAGRKLCGMEQLEFE